MILRQCLKILKILTLTMFLIETIITIESFTTYRRGNPSSCQKQDEFEANKCQTDTTNTKEYTH